MVCEISDYSKNRLCFVFLLFFLNLPWRLDVSHFEDHSFDKLPKRMLGAVSPLSKLWPEHMWFWASMLLMLESPSVEISMWVCFSWDLKHAPLVFNSFLERVLITSWFCSSILLDWLLWSVLWDCDIKLSSTLVWCYRFGKRFSSFRCAFSCTYCICWEVHRGRWLLGCWDAYFSFCNCGCCTLFLLWWFTQFAAGFHWFLLPLILASLLRIWC